MSLKLGDRLHDPSEVKSKRQRSCILVFSLWIFPFLLAAAQNLSITGRVVDSHGQPVPGARIFMTSDAGGYRTTNSSANGEFALAQLAPDRYTLRVEFSDFAPSTETVSLATENVSLTVILLPSESPKSRKANSD
jgi:hypothetical protein